MLGAWSFFLFVSAGMSCIVIGWGFLKIIRFPKGEIDYKRADRLQFLPMKIVDEMTCKKANRFATKNTICATGGVSRAPFEVLNFKLPISNLKINV